ncbi:MAG TPA: DUF4097 family beta strand repeat-containing protein [Bacteroidota bacterium]|nr:DUF4097 family beta strand repeat-containing protein [Bacteroidota bacterium]
MNPSPSTIIKICVFVLVGVLFGSSMIVYSNSRSHNQGHNLSDSEWRFDGDGGHSKHFEKSFTVNPGGTLTLNSDVGNVEVDTWDKNEVLVIADANGTENVLEKLDVTMSQEKDNVKVTGIFDNNGWPGWHSQNIDVVFKVTVPKKYFVRTKSAGGNMAVRQLDGSATLETSGGNVDADHINGAVDLRTSGGNVTAVSVNGSVQIETSGGEIRCTDIVGELNSHTSGGDVELTNVDGKISTETSGGSIHIRMSGENKGVYAHSSGGDIRVSVKESIKAMLDASTSGGRVKCELPITVKGEMDESQLRGAINGGGEVIRVETSGGDVKIVAVK